MKMMMLVALSVFCATNATFASYPSEKKLKKHDFTPSYEGEKKERIPYSAAELKARQMIENELAILDLEEALKQNVSIVVMPGLISDNLSFVNMKYLTVPFYLLLGGSGVKFGHGLYQKGLTREGFYTGMQKAKPLFRWAVGIEAMRIAISKFVSEPEVKYLSAEERTQLERELRGAKFWQKKAQQEMTNEIRLLYNSLKKEHRDRFQPYDVLLEEPLKDLTLEQVTMRMREISELMAQTKREITEGVQVHHGGTHAWDVPELVGDVVSGVREDVTDFEEYRVSSAKLVRYFTTWFQIGPMLAATVHLARQSGSKEIVDTFKKDFDNEVRQIKKIAPVQRSLHMAEKINRGGYLSRYLGRPAKGYVKWLLSVDDIKSAWVKPRLEPEFLAKCAMKFAAFTAIIYFLNHEVEPESEIVVLSESQRKELAERLDRMQKRFDELVEFYEKESQREKDARESEQLPTT